MSKPEDDGFDVLMESYKSEPELLHGHRAALQAYEERHIAADLLTTKPDEGLSVEEARETRLEQTTRWEDEGWLVPDCPGCAVFYAGPEQPMDIFAPGHRRNQWCESGKQPHCTCDRCF